MTIETWIVGWILSLLLFFYTKKGATSGSISLFVMMAMCSFVVWPIIICVDILELIFKE